MLGTSWLTIKDESDMKGLYLPIDKTGLVYAVDIRVDYSTRPTTFRVEEGCINLNNPWQCGEPSVHHCTRDELIARWGTDFNLW